MSIVSYGQSARLVVNNTGLIDPYFIWNPDPNNQGAYLVLDNPSSNAITYLDTSINGNFRTEAAQNKIRWNIGSSTGNYVINYGNQANIGFPLTLFIQNPGTSGSIVFSTYSFYPYLTTSGYGGTVPLSDSWDNTLYMSGAGVTHMNDYSTGLFNNSSNVVDRFWIIDTKESGWSYTTSPTVDLTFDHSHGDINSTNAIVPGITPLIAQRFNDDIYAWGDVIIPSTYTPNVSPGVSRVEDVFVSPSNFYRAWTLSNSSDPLPIELVDFRGECVEDGVRLTWITGTENNNDYFTVEKSLDLVSWNQIGTVDGSGNSLTPIEYNFIDENTGLTYYRLIQTDLDGTQNIYPMISTNCETNTTEIVTTWDDGYNANVLVNSSDEGIFDISLIDISGKIIGFKSQTIGNMTIVSFPKEKLSTGIYIFKIQNSTRLLQCRVMVY